MVLATIGAAVAGLIVGFLAGRMVALRTVATVTEERENLRREYERAREEWEEEKRDMTQLHEEKVGKKKDTIAHLKKELKTAEKEIKAIRRWADRQCRSIHEDFLALWSRLKLRALYADLPAIDKVKRVDDLENLARRLEEWMEHLSVAVPEYNYSLGLWHALSGHRREASSHFKIAAQKGLGVNAWLSLGDILWDLKKEEKARTAYEHCLRIDGQPERVFTRIAETALRRRKFDDAIEALERVLPRKKISLDAWILAARAYGLAKQDEEAIEACRKGRKSYLKSPALWANEIIPLCRLSRWEEAEEAYTRALELDEAYAEAPFYMGVAHMNHGDDSKARNYFDKALSLDGEHAEAHFCMGVLYNREQKYKKAIGCFERAVALKPDYAEAYYNMKESYEGLKNFEKAIAVLKKATKLNPEFR